MSAARRLHAKSWVENAGWEPLTTTPGVRSVVEVKRQRKQNVSHLCRVNYMPAVSSVVADAEKMTCECVRVSVCV